MPDTPFYSQLLVKMMNPMKQKPYKESSVLSVYRFLTTLNGGKPPSSVDFLLDRPVVLPFLEKYAIGTQRTILYAIRNVAKDFERQDILDVWKGNIEEAEAGKGLPEKQEKTEAQKKAYAKLETDKNGDAWDTILKRMEEHNKTTEVTIDYVVPNLYTLFPPRRNLDYTEMKVTMNYKKSMSKDSNYLVVGETEMRFVFNRYKTDGTYNQQVFEVPEDLVAVLKKWIETTGKTEGDYLLTKAGGGKMRSDDITDVLHRVFDKGISTQMLRHMYVDKYNTPDREKIIHEMMGDAEKMAHSISTQQNVYVKKP
jgi:hypothetical protein